MTAEKSRMNKKFEPAKFPSLPLSLRMTLIIGIHPLFLLISPRKQSGIYRGFNGFMLFFLDSGKTKLLCILSECHQI